MGIESAVLFVSGSVVTGDDAERLVLIEHG
jgi:hypothetical protein